MTSAQSAVTNASRRKSGTDDPAAAPGSSGPAGSAGFASRARRWIPELLKRPAQPQAAAPEDRAGDAAPESEGLVAVELFRDLAREASIVWVLPRSVRVLLSGASAGVPGVRVVTDDPAVADEIAALLSSDTGAVKAAA